MLFLTRRFSFDFPSVLEESSLQPVVPTGNVQHCTTDAVWSRAVGLRCEVAFCQCIFGWSWLAVQHSDRCWAHG